MICDEDIRHQVFIMQHLGMSVYLGASGLAQCFIAPKRPNWASCALDKAFYNL